MKDYFKIVRCSEKWNRMEPDKITNKRARSIAKREIKKELADNE